MVPALAASSFARGARAVTMAAQIPPSAARGSGSVLQIRRRKGVDAVDVAKRDAEAPSDADRSKRDVVVQGFERKAGLGKQTAEALERGLLRVACPLGGGLTKESCKEYTRQYKRLCTHLRQNPSLGKRLESGELQAESVAGLHDDELMPESHKKEREQFRQENLHEALGEAAEDSAHWTPSESFSCPRCKSDKCLYIQWNNGAHSYDDNNKEPALTLRCMDCKNLWREDEVEGGGRAAAGAFDAAADVAVLSSAVPPEEKRPALWDRSGETWLLPASSV